MINNKFKLSLILLFIACLLFVSVSSVSAQQVTGNNFTALNDTIKDYSEIELTQNIIVNENEKANFTNGIEITKDLTINGNGYSIDGNKSVRIFQITNSSATLTLINITLKNGNATNGGAIYSIGDVNLKCLENVNFENNKVSGSYPNGFGGVIYAKNDVRINATGDVNFINNTASSGGAIYAKNDVHINVTGDVNFINNINQQFGTIYTESGAVGINATNVDFNNNVVTGGGGGAIYATTGAVSINATNVDFNNNKVTSGDGGAIYAKNGAVSINAAGDVNFENNIAETFNKGGAIYAKNVCINATNVTFNNNKAYYGGAIYADNGVVGINATGDVNFNNNKATGNGQSQYGGAIYANNNVCINATGDVNFNNNFAEAAAGAIYAINGMVKINSTNGAVTFKNNKVSNKGGFSSEKDGGAIFAKDVIIDSFGDVCFINNTAAAGSGGAIKSNTIVNITSTYGNVTFENNKANSGNGGAIFANTKVIIDSFGDVCFINNTASSQGGAIKSNTIVKINSTNGAVIFKNNKASTNTYGGIIKANSNVTINSYGNVCFNNNTDAEGAICSENGMVNITSKRGNVIFENNKCSNSNAGAIIAGKDVIIDSYGNVCFKNNTADNSVAVSFGGAIYSGGMVNIISRNGAVIFENNKAKTKGGAIYANNNITINSFGNVCFINNSASSQGGAIYAKNGMVNITNAVFYGNDATNCKIIYVGDWANSNLTVNFWGVNYKNKTQINESKIIGYDNNGQFVYYAPDNWVLLNVTAPENIMMNKNNTFSLKFNSYTNGTWIRSYDNFTSSMFVKTNFTDGVATNYPVAPGDFNVNPNKAGESTLSILNIYTGKEITNITFNVINMLNVNLRIIAENRVYGEDAIIYIYLIDENNKTVTGKVNLTVDKVYEVDINNGLGQQVIKGLNATEYTVFANYTGDSTHFNTTNTTTFNVAKKEVVLNANDLILVIGESGNLTITVSEPIDGTVTVKYNNKTETVTINNGKGILTISNLTVGNYTVEISLNDNTNYFANNITSKIIVTKPTIKEDTYITVKAEDIVYGENSTFTIKLVDKNGKAIKANITISLFKNGAFIKSVNRTTNENGTYTSEIIGDTTGFYGITVSYDGNDTMKASNNYTSFKVSKLDTDLDISINNITYGENGVLTINLGQEIDVPVILIINGEFIKTIDLIDGYAQTNLTGYNAGNYVVSVIFEGNENYKSSRDTTNWTVNKVETDLTISVNDIIYGETGILNITLNPAITTFVTLIIDGNVVETINLVNGRGQSNLTGYNAGRHVVTIIFDENENYEFSRDTANWVVNKVETDLSISVDGITYGETGKLIIDLNQEIDVPVTLIIDGKIVDTVDLIKGHKVVDLTGYNAGAHIVTVRFEGDVNYEFSRNSTIWTVQKAETTLIITTNNITTDDEEIISVDVGNNLNGRVTIRGLFNNTISIQVINGTGSITISKLNRGTYDIVGTFMPQNRNYNRVLNTSSFTVTDENIYLEVEDLTKIYGDSEKFEALLINGEGEVLANETVTFTINGVSYNRITDEKGIASLAINLNEGEYPIKVTYGDIKSYATVYVLSTIKANDTTLMYKNGTRYEAIFTDTDGKALANTTVTFNINGVEYVKITDANGKASMAINLQPGEYTVTAYNPVTMQAHSNTITVLSPVVGEDLTKKYSEKASYNVHAYDNQGNPLANATITININGVFYNRVTDSNGIAHLNINLIPGEYIATASFNGASTSNKITVLEG